VASQQLGPNDLNIGDNVVPPPPPPTFSSAATPLAGPPSTPGQSLPQDPESYTRYQQLLNDLLILKGTHKGGYKCHHCKVNNKAMPPSSELEEGVCVCGCSHLKAVMEKDLVARGILGQIVPDDVAATNIRRSISYTDWLKMEYIWGRLIGFEPIWLLDSASMKAGLLAKAKEL
jgi:hypothetical protein